MNIFNQGHVTCSLIQTPTDVTTTQCRRNGGHYDDVLSPLSFSLSLVLHSMLMSPDPSLPPSQLMTQGRDSGNDAPSSVCLQTRTQALAMCLRLSLYASDRGRTPSCDGPWPSPSSDSRRAHLTPPTSNPYPLNPPFLSFACKREHEY